MEAQAATRRLRRAQRVLLGERGERDLAEHAVELQAGFEALREYVEEASVRLDGRLAAVERALQGAIAYRSLVRYDAYNEQSGQQSFSIAVLDDTRSGIVLSCIHHREQARVYAKEVRGGAAELARGLRRKRVEHGDDPVGAADVEVERHVALRGPRADIDVAFGRDARAAEIGDRQALDSLVQRLARGGRITLAGFYDAVSFAFPPAFMREAEIRISAQWAPGDLAEARDLGEALRQFGRVDRWRDGHEIDCPGDARLHAVSRKARDLVDAGLAGGQLLPVVFFAAPERGHDAIAGHDDGRTSGVVLCHPATLPRSTAVFYSGA